MRCGEGQSPGAAAAGLRGFTRRTLLEKLRLQQRKRRTHSAACTAATERARMHAAKAASQPMFFRLLIAAFRFAAAACSGDERASRHNRQDFRIQVSGVKSNAGATPKEVRGGLRGGVCAYGVPKSSVESRLWCGPLSNVQTSGPLLRR